MASWGSRFGGVVHHVIVGNSIAGIEAAIALRGRDADAKITVVSSEHDHPFARVSLMYLFCGQLSLKDTEFHGRDLYERMRFQRVRDRVTSVDPNERRILLKSGENLAYDRLLLAVGSRARPLPWLGAYDAPGVHHFVSLTDYEGLDRAARPGMSVAVVGGGLIGVEAAEVLHLRGLKVHFLIREPWYFPVALDDREAEVVAAHIRHQGVDCRTDTPISGFERRGAKVALALPSEALTVDLVVGAIGVIPNTDFLADSAVQLNAVTGGIEVGDKLESLSAPGVFAAGDCANVTWLDGSRRPEQLWYTARDQGRVAARAMLGDEVRYRRGTWYNSAKFFDIEYTTAGYLPVSTPEKTGKGSGWQTWYQQAPSQAVTQRIVLKDGVIKGFNGLGTRWDHQAWMRWIHERRALSWVLPRLAEAQFDEEFMPRVTVLPTATLTEGA